MARNGLRGSARSGKPARRLAALGVAALASAGCGTWSDAPSKIYGSISYHGGPIRKGVIVLSPESGVAESWGMGVIDEHGHYSIQCARSEIPLPAGRYGVSFRRPITLSRIKGGPDRKGDTPQYVVGDASTDIPERYIDAEHPVFSIDVGDRPLQVDITLRD
jgi:hypothetical protein